MDKQTIIRNFSRCASFYDRYADVQNLAALQLLDQIKENNFTKILEIGCGTGNYTLLLREKFKHAELKAIDISKEMTKIASEKLKGKGIKFILADAESITLDGNFDLITANACFQWFTDLEETLVRYKNYLIKDGIIAFSIFGPATFWELNVSLKYLLNDASVCAENFITREKIKRILKRNFKKICVKQMEHKESFSYLSELLRKMRYTGERGDNNRKIFFNKQLLEKLEELYLNRFGQIRASYEILFCRGLR